MMGLIASAILASCAPTSETMRAVSSVDPMLVRAVIANESHFDRRAVSPAGARGLGQLMPATAAGLGVCDSFDVTENVIGSALYLRGLLDRFGGDVRLAVAGYNAGPGAVARYGDVPPYAETQRYVRSVLGTYAALGGSSPAPSGSPHPRPTPRVTATPKPFGTGAWHSTWGAPK